MQKSICLIASIIILSSASFAQTAVEKIKAGAKTAGEALLAGDLERFVDLTYPELVRLMGGRAKMISTLKKERRGMQAQGFDMLSLSFDGYRSGCLEKTYPRVGEGHGQDECKTSPVR